MLIVGLTGGIATGKTTVARLLQGRGAAIVDADELAREVVEPGQAAHDEVVDRFGKGILLADGRIDRPRLGRIVFDDSGARRDLERITHPRISSLIAERVAQAVSNGAPLVVVDVPLLFEGERQDQFDGVLVAYAPREVQMQRLQERDGFEADEARRRLDAQMPIDDKVAAATWVIDNSGSPESTRDQVSRWWAEVVG